MPKMKYFFFSCLILFSACSRVIPNLHMSEKEAKEYIKKLIPNHKHEKTHFFQPLVANEKTAIKIAEAVLFDVYGEDNIKGERPYTIGKADGYWVLYGYLLPVQFGGTFEIIIDAANGEVVHLTHYK